MEIKKITTKQKIMNTAWNLFVKQGYDNTTINQIIEQSKTSRGSFYHHFKGKEELLFSVAYIFDNNYEAWEKTVDNSMHAADKLLSFDAYVLNNIETSPYRTFLTTLYGMQVMTDRTRHILNRNRRYYQIISIIIKEGLEKGELKSNLSYLELAEDFSIIERGLTYDWCLNQNRYSLLQYGQRIISIYLNSIRV
ncbi:TetR/AcrR family transcriptional regulator [Sedimentibacter sp. zth1]|uniref:TetR/AcrR family transcriptional regulator n=1 Tax=Sedimentibacter sp. zth1 TaxID=2816908 RepID=UPI001A91F9A6|nr:TetR/AcrR family transcriptional regulator [Sedimentibacter sp. zth1]QSX05234.1 TetR/AcrR family transcriptional regulator [Sedimentibacter sp. zth1]